MLWETPNFESSYTKDLHNPYFSLSVNPFFTGFLLISDSLDVPLKRVAILPSRILFPTLYESTPIELRILFVINADD